MLSTMYVEQQYFVYTKFTTTTTTPDGSNYSSIDDTNCCANFA